MHLTPLIAVSAALFTWSCFWVCMKYYFRYSRRANPNKNWLIHSSYVCTLTQLAVLALFRPSSQVLGWAGIVCYLLANALFWWSLAAHGRTRPAFAFVPVAPASFTRSGPYRLIRHPIYSAYLLAWLAGAMVAGKAWLLVTVVWMWLIYNRAARQEEQSFLDSTFRPQYQEYRKGTGRFVPKLV